MPKRTIGAATGSPSTKRTKRQINLPDRFGSSSASERNAFFENVVNDTQSQNSATQHSASTEQVQSESAHTSVYSDDDDDEISVGIERPLLNIETVLSKLDEILIRISAIEKFEAKVEVRLRNIEKFMDRFSNGNSEADVGNIIEKSQLGLPVKTKVSLDELEKDLESQEKRQQCVSNECRKFDSRKIRITIDISSYDLFYI